MSGTINITILECKVKFPASVIYQFVTINITILECKEQSSERNIYPELGY